MKLLKQIISILAFSLLCFTMQGKDEYEKLFANKHKISEGLITQHLVSGKLYFEFPKSLLGREMLLGSTIKSISDNANGIVGVKPHELKHISFIQRDSCIQLVKLNTSYLSKDKNINNALSKSQASSIIKIFKIKTYSPDSSAVVFDVSDFFLDGAKEMGPFSDYGLYSRYKREESLKKELSFISDIKSFENNISVTSSLTYTYNMKDGSGKAILKDAPLTAEMTRSLLLLPKEIYHPRMADYRIGVFFTGKMMPKDNVNGAIPVYFANRWRLEPSDTIAYRSGELVKPVKPIVFYIDSDFPEWWKPYIKEGIEQWQEMFETIGFKDAIIAKSFEEQGSDFDPENIAYNCVRYAPIGIRNAMGPSWVDPRSGEIINAAVYLYHDIITLISDWMYVQTSQVDERIRSGQIPQEILGDALRYVVSHEVGHTLGFMHNMSASSVIPVEKLRDPEYTKKYGTTTSIMDYARFNYVAQPEDKDVKLTPPRFGVYDQWLIKWTYTPLFDFESFEEEAEFTSKWITDSVAANPIYRYGKQQMGAAFFDPRSQTEDLGDNSVQASKYGVANLKYIMSNYMSWIDGEKDPDYELRVRIFNGIIQQYIAYSQHVLFNVGGLYKNEVKEADTMPRWQNIPRQRQIESLEYLLQMVDDVDWLCGDAIKHLPVIGSPDYAVRANIMSMIMLLPTLCHLSDNIESKQFTSKECTDYIFDNIMKPSLKQKPLTVAQKQKQDAFVVGLLQNGGFPLASKTKSFSDEKDYFHNPIAGFEWSPRNIFNNNGPTKSFYYYYLNNAKTIMQKAMRRANETDKAHYELLIKTIEYGIE